MNALNMLYIKFSYFQGLLDSSASSDPDFPGTDGMSFVWYCRDAADNEFNPSNLTHEPLVSNDDLVTLPENAVSWRAMRFLD